MSGFLLLSLIWFWGTQWGFSTRLNANPPLSEQVVKAITEEEKAFETFWTENLKTILQNILLPVLTAILGYTFGSSQRGKSEG
jgi:hypothetical protein